VIPGIEMNTDVPGGEVHILAIIFPMKIMIFWEEPKILKQARVYA